jgi:hypothetical protein
MKEIVQIKEYDSSFCLVSLRPKKLAINNITVSNSGSLDRLGSSGQIKNAEDDMNVFKVIALSMNNVGNFGGISLTNNNKKFIKQLYEEGNIYLEIECNENGYPDKQLVVYNSFSRIIDPNLTPAEALKRIQELNENNTRNN